MRSHFLGSSLRTLSPHTLDGIASGLAIDNGPGCLSVDGAFHGAGDAVPGIGVHQVAQKVSGVLGSHPSSEIISHNNSPSGLRCQNGRGHSQAVLGTIQGSDHKSAGIVAGDQNVGT